MRRRRVLVSYDYGKARTVSGYDVPRELLFLVWDVLRLRWAGLHPRRYRPGEVAGGER